MSNTDRIIENVNATMRMEGMPLLDKDKERIKDCIEGKISFQDAIDLLVNKYMHKKVI
ncbi:antitoxin VbhA family protein [Clostridium gasigenes]|uniref:Antitoxin VbhA family protein n=1 Tax=Clostridium gasigenes TaxID=94869 RepID=A0A7X0VRF2_9CLOT|nr:antitoxin VbhA family protein [Clostridium gasigenes]MBB6714540.1 antitoxin VbhA family protein [Clostridium gasigenes]